MHRDLKPENFLFANKKETSALKAIDFGLSVFFKPGIAFHPCIFFYVFSNPYGLPYSSILSPLIFLHEKLCDIEGFDFIQVTDLMRLWGVPITWLQRF